MAMVKWSDFIPPKYAPVAYGLGAAAAGGGLGWLYDKLRGKKHTAKRVGIGALLGLLGGAGYGQYKLNSHISEQGKIISEVENENRKLRNINGLLNGLPYDYDYEAWDESDGEGRTLWKEMLYRLNPKQEEYVESLRRIAEAVNRIRDERDHM